MIVVCNTSPLTSLAAIGQFGLLRHLYSTLQIADGVWDELNAKGQSWPGRDEVAAADWIVRHTVQNQALVRALRRDLAAEKPKALLWPLSSKPDSCCWTRKRAGTQPNAKDSL